MLTLFTWPGRMLTRRAGGALPTVVSLMVYLIVIGAVVLLVGGRPRHEATTAPAKADQPTDSAALTNLPTGAPEPPPLVGPGGFVPLQSQAVKDAIHSALVSGATQRWQDGGLSGYAVPSVTTGTNGCRAVRYTIDQTPGAYGSITACDASGH